MNSNEKPSSPPPASGVKPSVVDWDIPESDLPELPKTLKEQREAMAHALKGATREECEAALGKDSVTDDPDGIHWNVAICREYWPVEVNRRRWATMMELMKKRHAADEERSILRYERTPHTRVYGPDGDVREVPEEVERMIEFKNEGLVERGLPIFRPVIAPKVRRKEWRSVAGGSR